MQEIQKIAIIGSGNVARHFCGYFRESHIDLTGVYGRNQTELEQLHIEFQTSIINDFRNIEDDTLVLVCVSDKAVISIIQALPKHLRVAYTSGSVNLSQINRRNVGVFYPLQSFTKNHPVDFNSVPFLIEANDKQLEEDLFSLAKTISRTVELADSEKRFHLHLAAVMVNNFTNHLYSLSEQYLASHKIHFELLHPLMEETLRKSMRLGPIKSQTGPAIRGDHNTIDRHLTVLNGLPKELYRIFSRSIQELHNTTESDEL